MSFLGSGRKLRRERRLAAWSAPSARKHRSFWVSFGTFRSRRTHTTTLKCFPNKLFAFLVVATIWIWSNHACCSAAFCIIYQTWEKREPKRKRHTKPRTAASSFCVLFPPSSSIFCALIAGEAFATTFPFLLLDDSFFQRWKVSLAFLFRFKTEIKICATSMSVKITVPFSYI